MSEYISSFGVGIWEDMTYRPIIEINGEATLFEYEVFTDKEACRLEAKAKLERELFKRLAHDLGMDE